MQIFAYCTKYLLQCTQPDDGHLRAETCSYLSTKYMLSTIRKYLHIVLSIYFSLYNLTMAT